MVGRKDKPDLLNQHLVENKASLRVRQRLYATGLVALIGVLLLAGWYYWSNRDASVETLVVGTGTFGSDAHSLMREVAEVVERHSTTLRIKVQPTRDASQNIALLNNDSIDVAVIRADTPVVSNIRVIAGLYPDMMQLIVRDDSGAYSIQDLADVKISIPEFGTDGFRSFWILGDHYDLPIDKMDWSADPFWKGAGDLLAGRVQALFTVRSLRDARLIRLFEDAQLKRLKFRLIPVRQAEALAVKRPFLSKTHIPAGTFTGATPVPGVDTITASVERILVSRNDVSVSAIRELTRILFEHRLDLTIRFSLASAISQPKIDHGLSVPLHEGAQAFYDRDEPSFIQENAEPLALLVTLITLMMSGLFALRSRFVSKQKNSADTYNYQLLDLQKQAAEETDPAVLAQLKNELNAVLETVVIALDTDEVTDDGFQSFSLLWGAVRETINDRLALVSRRHT